MQSIAEKPKSAPAFFSPEVVGAKPCRVDVRQRASWIDFVFAALSMATFLLWIDKFRYQGLLGESDLYWVLNGLLDGARKATYLASPHHYGKAFSFGYIMALYHFANHQTLIDRQRMIALINESGFWALAAGCVAFWLLTWSLYGLRAATISIALFSLSPMMLELGTSGHQILPAFAFFAAGSLCLLFPASGLRYWPLALLGFLFLLAALVTRAEIVLAFPFLVVARAEFQTLPKFLKCAAKRSIVPTLAYIAFLLLRRSYVESTPGTARLGSFLAEFLSVKKIPIGVLVILIGCGIATAIVGLFATFWAIRKTVTAPSGSSSRFLMLQTTIGPLTLMVPPLIFWIANPLPARHFILYLAGVSILSALLISTWLQTRPLAMYALVMGIVVTNQALGALTGPFIVHHIANKFIALPGDQHLLPYGLPVGSSWSYHHTYEAELLRTDRFGERVRDSCHEKLIVLTNREQEILSVLYHPDAAWNLKKSRIQKFPTWETQIENRRVIVLSELGGWPQDAVAAALADPALRDFKLQLDPRAISSSGHADIPSERLADLDCTR